MGRYFDAMRRHYGDEPFTARKALMLVASAGLGFSGWFNYPIQRALTDSQSTAIVFTAGIVLSLPACLAFWLPWSPGAMFLAKIHMKSVGQWVALAIALVMSFYVIITNNAYWLSQPAAEIGYNYHQVAIGYIIFYLLPGLLWAPVMKEEVRDTIEQQEMVEDYKLFTEKRIGLLRATLLEAEEYALRGWVNLLPQEKTRLVEIGTQLARGIERTVDGMSGTYQRATGRYQEFRMDEDAERALQVLEPMVKALPAPYYADALGEGDPYEDDPRVQGFTRERLRERGVVGTGRLREEQADRALRAREERARREEGYTGDTIVARRAPEAGSGRRSIRRRERFEDGYEYEL